MRSYRLVVTVAIVVSAVALGACGGDNEGEGGAKKAGTATEKTKTPSGGSARVQISETEYKLDPAEPAIKQAGTFEFVAKNDGKVVHALEVEGPAGEAKTANIGPGKSARLKVNFDEAGSYEMYCPVGNHKKLGMEGKVVVAGGSRGQSTSSEDKGGGSGGGGGY